MTVIKTLPQRQKLDNTPVAPDEVGEAMRRGVELVHPHDRPMPGQDDGYYGSYSNQVSNPPPLTVPLLIIGFAPFRNFKLIFGTHLHLHTPLVTKNICLCFG